MTVFRWPFYRYFGMHWKRYLFSVIECYFKGVSVCDFFIFFSEFHCILILLKKIHVKDKYSKEWVAFPAVSWWEGIHCILVFQCCIEWIVLSNSCQIHLWWLWKNSLNAMNKILVCFILLWMCLCAHMCVCEKESMCVCVCVCVCGEIDTCVREIVCERESVCLCVN